MSSNNQIKTEFGDIVLVSGTAWISRKIKKLSRRKGEAPTRISHVGYIVQGGSLKETMIAEAITGGFKVRFLFDSYKGTGSKITLVRDLTMTESSAILERKEFNQLNDASRGYGWGKIGLQAGDAWATKLLRRRKKDIYFFRRMGRMKKWPICSYVVACIKGAAGKSFGVEVGQAQPDDIDDFIETHPAIYRPYFSGVFGEAMGLIA